MSYKHKYQKYKKKYMNEGGVSRVDKKYALQLNDYLIQAKEGNLTVSFVQQLIHFFEECTQRSYDVEKMHLLEDYLSKSFIQKIATDSLPVSEIPPLARAIHQLNKADYYKWYS